MSDFNKSDVGCRIFKVGCRMAPISFRTRPLPSYSACDTKENRSIHQHGGTGFEGVHVQMHNTAEEHTTPPPYSLPQQLPPSPSPTPPRILVRRGTKRLTLRQAHSTSLSTNGRVVCTFQPHCCLRKDKELNKVS